MRFPYPNDSTATSAGKSLSCLRESERVPSIYVDNRHPSPPGYTRRKNVQGRWRHRTAEGVEERGLGIDSKCPGSILEIHESNTPSGLTECSVMYHRAALKSIRMGTCASLKGNAFSWPWCPDRRRNDKANWIDGYYRSTGPSRWRVGRETDSTRGVVKAMPPGDAAESRGRQSILTASEQENDIQSDAYIRVVD